MVDNTQSQTTTSTNTTAAMEKLELLSSTAILKQGLDGGHNTKLEYSTKAATPSLLQQQTQHHLRHSHSPCSVSSTISKPIFAVASTNSVQGLLLQHGATATTAATTSRATSSSPSIIINSIVVNNNTNNSNSNSNLASPVSTDGDDEFVATKETNLLKNKASTTSITNITDLHPQQVVVDESRSPVSSVEYSQRVVVGNTIPSPLPPTSTTYGGYHPLGPRYESFNSLSSVHQQHLATADRSSSSSAFSTYPPTGSTTLGTSGSNHNMTAIAPHPPSGGSGGFHQHHIPPATHNHRPHVGAGTDGGYYQQRQLPPRSSSPHNKSLSSLSSSPSYDELLREVHHMREQLKEKDIVVSSLQHRVNYLENQISELRQLPTGKISHIPVE
jgi:hypothetical protein